MNDMAKLEVLYNAFLACGIEVKKEDMGEDIVVMTDNVSYVFDKETGNYKHQETNCRCTGHTTIC